MSNRAPQFQLKFNGFIGLVMLILFFVLLFFIAKGIFTILSYAAPVFIIAALLINYRTVLGFLKYLWDLLRRKPLLGVLAIILTALGYAIVSGFLFGKSILDRRVRKYHEHMREQREGKLIDYEDITEDAEMLELDPPSASEGQRNSYDDFFNKDSGRS